MFNFYFSVYSQADIFHHLAGIQFDGKHAFYLLGIIGNGFFRERPQRDRAQQAEFDTFTVDLCEKVMAYSESKRNG